MLKNFHLILGLFCGFIIGILSLIQKDDIMTLMKKMMVTILLFSIMGIISKNYIRKIASNDINKKENRDSDNMQKDIETRDIETNNEETIDVN